MMSAPVRLLHSVFPPSRYPCSTNSHLASTVTCPYPGFGAEHVQLIMNAANLPYELVPLDSTLRSKLGGGFIATAYHMIQQGMVDSAAMTFSPNAYRTTNFKLSLAIPDGSQLGALVAPNSGDSSIVSGFRYLRVFELEVWLILLLVNIIVRLIKRWKRRLDKPSEFGSIQPTSGYFKLTIGWTALLMSVIMSLFGKGILARLLQTEDPRPFHDLAGLTELIKHSSMKVITPQNTAWMVDVRTNAERNEAYAEFIEALTDADALLERDNDASAEICRLLQSGHHTFMSSSRNLLSFQSHCCGLEMIEFPMSDFSSGIGNYLLFAKNESIHDKQMIDKINHAIIETFSGLEAINDRYISYLTRQAHEIKLTSDANKICSTDVRTYHGPEPLGPWKVAGVFIMWLSGCVFAISVCCIEVVCRKSACSRSKL